MKTLGGSSTARIYIQKAAQLDHMTKKKMERSKTNLLLIDTPKEHSVAWLTHILGRNMTLGQ